MRALKLNPVADGALGTGPNFVDPATLGAPGFNEFFYLRAHPDVAAAVRSGQYASGLDHYTRAGRAAGYQAFAQHATVWGGAAPANVTLYGGNVLHCGAAGDNVVLTGGSNVVYSGPGNDALSGGTGSDVIVFSGPRSRYRKTVNPDGSITIADMIAGENGADTIRGRFTLKFSDCTESVEP